MLWCRASWVKLLLFWLNWGIGGDRPLGSNHHLLSNQSLIQKTLHFFLLSTQISFFPLFNVPWCAPWWTGDFELGQIKKKFIFFYFLPIQSTIHPGEALIKQPIQLRQLLEPWVNRFRKQPLKLWHKQLSMRSKINFPTWWRLDSKDKVAHSQFDAAFDPYLVHNLKSVSCF